MMKRGISAALALFLANIVVASHLLFVCAYESYNTELGNKKVNGESKVAFMFEEEKSLSYIVGNNGTQTSRGIVVPDQETWKRCGGRPDGQPTTHMMVREKVAIRLFIS